MTFPGRRSYGAVFGLWLNLARVQARGAGPVAVAIGLALGGNPGADYWQSVADSEGQAKELEIEAWVRERERKAAAKHGFT